MNRELCVGCVAADSSTDLQTFQNPRDHVGSQSQCCLLGSWLQVMSDGKRLFASRFAPAPLLASGKAATGFETAPGSLNTVCRYFMNEAGSIKSLWRLSVTTTEEAEEAVRLLLENTFGLQPSSYVDYETRSSSVTIYAQRRDELSSDKCAKLKSRLHEIARCGLDVGSGRIRVARVRREDWAESWKRHFQPIEIAKALLVKPSWSSRRAKAGQAVVILDPGLSFGTGQHATTRFCLRELVRLRSRKTGPASLLDAGTGSGILAIAAAKLGYRPIVALDYDPEAIRIARGNAQVNAVGKLIQFDREDITKPPRREQSRYKVICANLIGNVLLQARDRIVAGLEPEGVVILAGILKNEFGRIRQTYEAAGLQMVANRSEKEWYSASFMLPKSLEEEHG